MSYSEQQMHTRPQTLKFDLNYYRNSAQTTLNWPNRPTAFCCWTLKQCQKENLLDHHATLTQPRQMNWIIDRQNILGDFCHF